MDGHFVPNLTMGPVIVEAIRRNTRLPLVHLMISEPDRYLQPSSMAGRVLPCTWKRAPCIARSRRSKLGVEAGVAINPATPVELADIAPDVDHVR
jgi:ribulose-phosphate 3-epimerase